MQNALSTVAVVGLGKIGLPLAVQYAQHGWHVIGCDVNPQVVEVVNSGQSHVQEEPGIAEAVADLVSKGMLSATTDTASAVRQATVVVVIVPVVVDEHHAPAFEAIDAATISVAAGLQPGTLVVYESTVPVGTTAGRFASMLEQVAHLRVGQDFWLAYSPERVSSGVIFRDLRTYPKIVGGVDQQSLDAGVAFYRSVLDAEIITMASTDEAEFVKLIETTYRDVNIALANEFARFADAYGLNVTAAIAAANSQPYSHIHASGLGVGGHCIPVYPYFLLASLNNQHIRIIDNEMPLLTLPRFARRINDSMAEYAVQRIEVAIGSLKYKSILILGVAYRGDVRETAFTSAKLLQDALLAHGATVYVDDPLFSDGDLHSLGYTPLTADHEREIQAIILQANHEAYQEFDFSRFAYCHVVLDGRKALEREKIEQLGMRYIGIGDSNCEKSRIQQDEHSFASSSFHEGGSR
jgi:nucleotide sugar dehydrogenase